MDQSRHAVTLLGAGTQGMRLAYMWSSQGRPVYLVDKNEQQLGRALDEIERFRSIESISDNSMRIHGHVIPTVTADLAEAVSKSWMVLECVPESLSLKRTVIQQLDQISHQDTIVASNSSSYTIEEILDGLPINHPERCVSLHSYWPPETSAIEVMGHPQTTPSILDLLMTETANHGFSPFLVRKSSTGYIYNRIWASIKRETLLLLSEGIATAPEIDSIFKNVLKTPKGPCEQMDVVGLDVVCDIEQHYADVRSGIPLEPRTLLREFINSGRLGVKSGVGFYDYRDGGSFCGDDDDKKDDKENEKGEKRNNRERVGDVIREESITAASGIGGSGGARL